jgi:hypothetical protein
VGRDLRARPEYGKRHSLHRCTHDSALPRSIHLDKHVPAKHASLAPKHEVIDQTDKQPDSGTTIYYENGMGITLTEQLSGIGQVEEN